jgi:inorganic pyrophosphatase
MWRTSHSEPTEGDNKKTTLVFFEWKYHTSGFLGRIAQAKKTTKVIFPLKKHTNAVLSLSHNTKWEHFEAFLARIVAHLIQKFKTQSSAVTLQMTRWRYAEESNDVIRRYANRSDDVTWARR